MTSNRPYLVRALHEWIVDNGMTPHLLVNADWPGTDVPRGSVQNGKIVLNIAPRAVHGLNLGLDRIEFSARFGGRPTQVLIPAAAVLAIYARENGQGMVFKDEPETTPPPADPKPDKPARPKLSVVK